MSAKILKILQFWGHNSNWKSCEKFLEKLYLSYKIKFSESKESNFQFFGSLMGLSKQNKAKCTQFVLTKDIHNTNVVPNSSENLQKNERIIWKLQFESYTNALTLNSFIKKQPQMTNLYFCWPTKTFWRIVIIILQYFSRLWLM